LVYSYWNLLRLAYGAEVALGFASEDYPAGAHICYLYHDDDERRRVIPAFVKSSLSAGMVVSYFADVPDEGSLTEALEELGVLPVDKMDQNRLEIFQATSFCCPDNRFVPAAMLARLRGRYARGRANGDNGACVAAEMTWALHGIPGTEKLVAFEDRINGVVATHPMTILCQYDMRRFDGATAFGILGVHPMLLSHGQVIPNPY
jgi:hypothetical protein